MVRQSNGRDDKKWALATAVDSAGVAFRRPGARFRHPVHETAISRWPGNIFVGMVGNHLADVPMRFDGARNCRSVTPAARVTTSLKARNSSKANRNPARPEDKESLTRFIQNRPLRRLTVLEGHFANEGTRRPTLYDEARRPSIQKPASEPS